MGIFVSCVLSFRDLYLLQTTLSFFVFYVKCVSFVCLPSVSFFCSKINNRVAINWPSHWTLPSPAAHQTASTSTTTTTTTWAQRARQNSSTSSRLPNYRRSSRQLRLLERHRTRPTTPTRLRWTLASGWRRIFQFQWHIFRLPQTDSVSRRRRSSPTAPKILSRNLTSIRRASSGSIWQIRFWRRKWSSRVPKIRSPESSTRSDALIRFLLQTEAGILSWTTRLSLSRLWTEIPNLPN